MAKTLDEVRLDALSLADEDRRALSDDLPGRLQSADDRAFVAQHIDDWERRAEELSSGAVKAFRSRMSSVN